MQHGVRMITGSLAVAASVALMTCSALADGNRPGQPDGRPDTHGSPQVPAPTPSPFMRTYSPLPFNPRPPVQHPFRPPRGGTSVIVVPVPAVPSLPMGLPYQYDQTYDQTIGGGPGEMYPPPPPGPPTDEPPVAAVMQYPNGRYELRGDGFTSPYAWVWVPNPPPPPPLAPPSNSPAPVAPPATARQSSESEDFFSFMDDQGVLHWTDRWDSIPEKYRSKAKRLPL